MKIFSKSLNTVLTVRKTGIPNNLFMVPYKNYASKSRKIKPVVMSKTVFDSTFTNPAAPPLVIMHGLLGSRQNWWKIGKRLEATTKRKIINLDARNHGDSPHHPEHTSAHMAADLAYMINEEDIDRVSVMGYSMGGRAMMYFAMKHPQLVEKAIIVDVSPISIPNNFEEMEHIFFLMKNIEVPKCLNLKEGKKVVANLLMDATRDEETIDHLLRNLQKKNDGGFVWRPNIEAIHNNFMNYNKTQGLSQFPPFLGPVLFIAAENSNYFNPADWPRIRKLFPNAKVKWLDTGHFVHYNEPGELMGLVTEFLSKVCPPT